MKLVRLAKKKNKKKTAEGTINDVIWQHVLWQTQTIFGAHCPFRMHNKQKSVVQKILLNTVEYMRCLQWQNRPTYRVLICCAPAQMPKLLSAERCTFKEVFSPWFLLRHISRLPTASVSTHSGTHTHTHTHTHKSPRAFSHMHTKVHAQSWHMCTHTHTHAHTRAHTRTHAHTPPPHTGKYPLAPEFRLL